MRVLSSQLFPTEEIIPKEKMIGRDKDFLRLQSELSNGVSAVISAPRRTGKSSLLQAVLAEMKAEEFYIVYIDLWKIADIEQLATTLIAEAIGNRSASKQLMSKLKKGWKWLTTSEVEDLVNLTIDLDTPQLNFAPSIVPDRQALLEYALRLPQQIAENDNKRIIVCFDEFQNIVELDNKQQTLQKLMVSCFKEAPDVSFVFAGSVFSLMESIFSDGNNPFGKFAGSFRMSKIDKEKWHKGIKLILQRDQVSITDEALQFMVDKSHSHPYCLMLIAQQAHLIAVAQDSYKIDLNMTYLGYERAYDREREKHQQMIERVRSLNKGQLALKILIDIANAGTPYQRAKDAPAKVARRINDLEKNGFIINGTFQKSSIKRWEIFNPLFREYCLREFSF